MLLSFVKFQVKPINFDGMSKSSAIILDCWISQSSVATQLRQGKSPYKCYTESFLGNLPVKDIWKSVNICRSYDQK